MRAQDVAEYRTLSQRLSRRLSQQHVVSSIKPSTVSHMLMMPRLVQAS